MKIKLPTGSQFSYFDGNEFYYGAEYEGMVQAGTIEPMSFNMAALEAHERKRKFVCTCPAGVRYATDPNGEFNIESARLENIDPFVVIDWITLKCNYSCSYCYTNSPAWTKKNPKAKTRTERSANDRKKMVRLIMDNVEGHMRYKMIGGEPLLMEGWDEIAEAVTSIEKVRFVLYTNASMLDRMGPLLKGHLDPAKVEVVMGMHPAQRGFNADDFLRTAVALRRHGYGLVIIAVDLPINEPWLSENEKVFNHLGLFINRYKDVRACHPDFEIKGVSP